MKTQCIFFIFFLFFFCASCSVSAEREVTSFEECVAAGNKVLKSFPPRCVTTDGIEFVQKGKKLPRCKDLCGDGVCQEIVCEAIGVCPCAETPESCPKDCFKK